MPPTGAEDKVKDPEYKNWLRVSLALHYLKVGLCSFIQGEVDAMHQFLQEKLYKGSAVSATKCTSCKSEDVLYDRNSYTWKFKAPCPLNLCNTWLSKLLAFHISPRSSKIYWENCNVNAWPFVPWECAKIYMPRGQLPTNNGPDQSDSQALLTLISNCTYFHNKLSAGDRMLIQRVCTIRNKVMHSEDMRLSDYERKSFIQDIILFLEDPSHLKSLKECKQAVTDINKINNDSLDVFSNINFEMKALSECVNECRQELGVLKVETEKTVDSFKETEKTVNFLKEELQDLKVQFDNFEEKTKDKVGDLDTKCQKMGTRVTKLSRSVVNAASGLKHVKEEVKTLRKEAVTNQSQQLRKFRKVNEEIQLIKGKTTQAIKATDQVSGKAEGPIQPTEKDVRDIQLLLIKAYESVQIISISPVLDTAVNFKDLEDFYTDIVIAEETEESAQKRKYEQQVNQEKITSLRQFFKKDDKKVTRIILKAPAGQGKSTFCRKLVHTWCSVQKKKFNHIYARISDKSETSGLKDEDEMLRFDVLLYICLRDISDEKTLMDVIYTQFPLHESQELSHKSHIETLIGQGEENKVLLIMDGLDEMDNSSSFIEKIMQKSLYPHLTVLATTRPWKIGQLGLIKSAHIHLLLDLQGFNYENSMLFAKRIFDKCYKDEYAIAQFEQDISNNFMIRSLIHVPLLLLFIVHVWYERKSFPETIHELYLEILNVMVKRYMEGKERKQKSKARQDDKKYVVWKTWPLESITFSLTPKLRSHSLVQHFGEEFLAALCEVANHVLITDVKVVSLVFEEKDLLELLGKDGLAKLQITLDMGILSKSELPGIFRKKICLTFLHKTVQEFLAAINICCREGRCSIFLDSLNTLDDVSQNEKIIMFIAGISTSHCQKISEKIYEVCDKYMDQHRNDLVDGLCRLYRDCIVEACGEPVSLKLYSLFADNQKDWNILQSVLMNTSDVRTWLKCLKLFECNIDYATLDLSEFTSLTELRLRNVTMKGKLLLSKSTQLRCLKLRECSLDDATLDLSECTSLIKFSLASVTMKGKLLLSKCTQLLWLELGHCSLDDVTLDLSECTSLTEFILASVTMKCKLLLSKCTQLKYLQMHHCWLNDVILDLSECTSLTKFSLAYVTIKCKLSLSKCTQLRYLQMHHCWLDDVTLDLSECTSLTEFRFAYVTMNGKLLLSKCTQLSSLKLAHCRFDDATLDLSEYNQLTKLSLAYVTMNGKLLLSKWTSLQCLKLAHCSLDDVTLDLSGCIWLIKVSLPYMTIKGKLLLSACNHLSCLKLAHCNLNDATLDLSECDRLNELNFEYMTMKGKLLLPKYTWLRKLKLVHCTFDDATLDLLESNCLKRESYIDNMIQDNTLDLLDSTHLKFSRLNVKLCDGIQEEMLCQSQCKQSEIILMNSIDMGHALLSLDNMSQLFELTIDNITVSQDKKGMLCNKLSQCKQLEKLLMKNVDLCDAVLNLDSMNRLYTLTLDNVTMSKDSKGMLCNSLSQCKTLRTLLMKNMDLCDALLSLDSVNCLYTLTLDNVTMSKESKRMLCNGLSQCKQLHILSMKNVDLCDAVLNLDSVNCLEKLTLDNVTMSKESKRILCNSLSQCKQLHILSMKNVDLCDAVLSLDGMDCLEELTLGNVTLNNESKRMFFKSHSKSQWVQTLSTKNVDLDDVLHSFYNFHSLCDLELDNVTISIDSKIMLFVILSQFEQLTTLSLKNLDLTDGRCELYNMKRLTCITIDNIEMCKISKVLMCNSLSQCIQLEKVSLKNLDLGDGQLNLNSLNRLDELTLDNITVSKDSMEMLCNSLSQCAKLRTLSLKNLDLGDALLRLGNIEKPCNITICKDEYEMLHESMSMSVQHFSLENLDLDDDNQKQLQCLIINNVTMCKDGYVMLCKSISACACLRSLSLANVDLGDVIFSLDNLNKLDKLELVNITMSLQCVDYIKPSLQYLKSYHHYSSAHTGELIIEKSADNCEKCVVNYTYEQVHDDDDDDRCSFHDFCDDDDGDDFFYDEYYSFNWTDDESDAYDPYNGDYGSDYDQDVFVLSCSMENGMFFDITSECGEI